MPVRSRSLFAGLGLALLTAGLLTACATPAGSTGTTPTPASTGTDDSSKEQDVDAAWLDGGRMIGVVTQGSSTCVPVADEATYVDGVMKVTLVEPEGDKACTRDFVPRVTLVGVPEGVDPAKGVEIEVTGDGWHGDTDLDGVEGLTAGGETDYLPSAGWTDVDGQFVILSWGSSSCAPAVENTEATSATEVTVTFVTPPADQVCTMDMAPRGVVTAVNGLEDEDAGTFAILTGAEFDNVRIPVYPN
ncbi:hypothetical protein ACFC1I_05205 [Microbacterium sp. NPDC056044]|uniref:hypothetical protein n=1 Tax=Microbacterium sp. NPDC056044 TaxID=3345690 RepID=UPI0035E26CB7